METYSEEDLKAKFLEFEKFSKKQNLFSIVSLCIFIIVTIAEGVFTYIDNPSIRRILMITFSPLFSLSLFFVIYGFTYSFRKKRISMFINKQYEVNNEDINNKDWIKKYKDKNKKLKQKSLILSLICVSIFLISLVLYIYSIITNKSEDSLSILGVVTLLLMISFFIISVFPLTLFFLAKISIYQIDGYTIIYYFGFSNSIIVEGELKEKSFIPCLSQILLPNNNLVVFIPDKYISSVLIVLHHQLGYLDLNSNDFSLPDIKK